MLDCPAQCWTSGHFMLIWIILWNLFARQHFPNIVTLKVNIQKTCSSEHHSLCTPSYLSKLFWWQKKMEKYTSLMQTKLVNFSEYNSSKFSTDDKANFFIWAITNAANNLQMYKVVHVNSNKIYKNLCFDTECQNAKKTIKSLHKAHVKNNFSKQTITDYMHT